MPIKIEGRVKVVNEYTIQLDMTEEEFFALSAHEQNKRIEQEIDFNKCSVVDVELDDDADITTVE